MDSENIFLTFHTETWSYETKRKSNKNNVHRSTNKTTWNKIKICEKLPRTCETLDWTDCPLAEEWLTQYLDWSEGESLTEHWI